MKARVKETGEIVEVHTHDDADFQDRQGRFYWEHQLYFGTLDDFDMDEPTDYWEKLKHQYAGMAMQGLMTNSVLAAEFRKDPNNGIEDMSNTITRAAVVYATALIEKLKSESNEKTMH